MSVFPQDVVTIISAISGIATIIASIIAILTLLIWRKQQRYAPMFNAVMELEDNFQLLLREYRIQYERLYQHHRLVLKSINNSLEYQKKILKEIIEAEKKNQTNEKIAQVELSYQLSYAKANRFDISLDSYEQLSYEYLRSFFEKHLNLLEPKNLTSSDMIDPVVHDFVNECCSITKLGLKHFKEIRKSL